MRGLFLILLLSGCSITIERIRPAQPMQPVIKTGCAKFELPDKAIYPTFPDIPRKVLASREATDKILFEYVKEIKQMIKEERVLLLESYSKHIESCL